MPAVSILVPSYNRADLLKVCLDSLLATTVPCEIIVSDNHSEDGTDEMMKGYDDPRLRYYRQPENIGWFDNHNFLLAQASKDYICLFGDDDIALPGCFEMKLALLDNNPDIVGAYSLSRIMDSDGNLAMGARVNGVPDVSFVSGRDEFSHLVVNCCISWQTLVFRRELYERHGGLKQVDNVRLAIDWNFLIGITQGRHLAFINEPTVGVRIHNRSIGNKVARDTGALAEDMVHTWRRWLIEGDDYPVVTGNTWNMMQQMLASGVQSCYGRDDMQLRRHMAWFETLKADYQNRMNRRFYAQLKGWVPDQVELGEDGLPLFRPGRPPLNIDSQRRAWFLLHPDWAGDAWQDVVRTYLRTFTKKDDVELILWLDPGQGVAAEQAVAWVEALSAEVGTAGDDAPDMLLLPESLAPEQVASLYGTVHAVVAPSESRSARRALQVGTHVITRPEPAIWRHVLNQMLGIKPTGEARPADQPAAT
jgi:hypothetical protein